MKVHISHPGEAQIELISGERFYFPLSYQSAGHFGIRLFPPLPFSSPIARWLHGRYRLAVIVAPIEGARLVLNEPDPLSQFHVLVIAQGQHYFIDCAHLVGFSFPEGGTIATQPMRLMSPACWLIGHPLPVIANGPGTILLSGRRLREELGQVEALSKQVVAFDARARWIVRAPQSDSGVLSQLWNIVSGQCRIIFLDEAVVVRSQVMPSVASSRWHAIFLALVHLAVIGAIATIIGW